MKKQLFILILALLMVCSCFTACGDDAELKGIIMKTQPTKTVYLVGDTFDPAGATVELTYSDGKTETKALTTDMLPASLTFTEAGYFQLPVTYVENGITKTAFISVKVSDPSTSGQMTGLAAAQADATAILTAYYNAMVFTAPANYPAAPDKLATDAKAVYDAAIAAFANAADSAAVYEILGKAQADLNALDNYIDWYAAEKVSALENTFETEYTANKKFIEDYNDKLVVFKRQVARILRSDNLAEIDALVDGLDTELENAKNILNELIEKLLKFTWVFDLEEDPTLDANDANLQNYYDIYDIMMAMPQADYLYQIEFIARMSAVDSALVDALAPAAGIHATYQEEVLDVYYDDASDTYNLYEVLEDTSYRMEELLEAREEADKVGGVEDIIDAAIEGWEYGAIAANSARHQALMDAKDVFDAWVMYYDIDEVNEDLVDNAETLKWLIDVMQNIVDVYADPEYQASIPAISGIPTQIIYNNTALLNALKDAEDVIAAFEEEYADFGAGENTEVPGWGSIIVNGDQVYLITNYDMYVCAAERQAELKSAADEAAAEGGLVGLINAINTPIVLTSNAQIDPALLSLSEMAVDYLLSLTNNFVFESGSVTEAQTEATIIANWQAILGGQYTVSWPLAANKGTDETLNGYDFLMAVDARYDTLVAAKANAETANTGVIALINTAISGADWKTNNVTLDSGAVSGVLEAPASLTNSGLGLLKSAYATWKETYKIDEANDGTAILGDAFTAYDEAIEEYTDLYTKVGDLKTAITEKTQGEITLNSNTNLTALRAQFAALADANSDTTASKQNTYQYVANYADLCEAEAKLFMIRYASLVQGDYEQALKDMRNDYTALIGGDTLRANDNKALGDALALKLKELHELQENVYTVAYFKDAIMNFGVSVEWAPESKVEGVTYLYDEVVEALDAHCDAAETAFKLAARYIVTGNDTDGYTLTIYVGGAYDANTTLNANGNKVASYKAIVIDSLVGAVDVTLNGFVADDVVIGTPVTTFALRSTAPTVTLNGATVNKLTVNTACNVVIADNDDDETAAVAEVEVNAPATITNNDAAAIEVKAEAAVVITAVADVTLTTTAVAEVTTTAKATIVTSADITVKADTIKATVTLPEVEEGETAVAPEIKMEANGKIDLGLGEGIKSENAELDSASGEINIENYIGDGFGEGDDSTEDDDWTEVEGI